MKQTETVELFERELGGAGRAPLVLLHGLLGSGRNWQTAGAGLAEVAGGRHVWAPDARNHGKSPWHGVMSYEAMVADVLAWMDRRGLESVDLMGHSMGGKVAMALACRYPARVRRLVVVDIAPRSYLSHGHRAEFAAMNELRLPELRSRGEAELKMEGRVPDWAMRKFLTTNLERAEDGAWRWAVNLPVLTAALPEVESNPLAADERFAGPVLFLRGGKSRYVREEDGAAITAHFPEARVETIADAGHNPHMETREEFCARAGAFLGEGVA
ncbi:MAG: alpha/beta fold hydrolase [Opitutaceae bacterium]|jgi:pimeloyl-ACP methyl ester carboxylesterase|nr:alpha/beta fold hydrolase [Opitutaceae bacterium]